MTCVIFGHVRVVKSSSHIQVIFKSYSSHIQVTFKSYSIHVIGIIGSLQGGRISLEAVKKNKSISKSSRYRSFAGRHSGHKTGHVISRFSRSFQFRSLIHGRYLQFRFLRWLIQQIQQVIFDRFDRFTRKVGRRSSRSLDSDRNLTVLTVLTIVL